MIPMQVRTGETEFRTSLFPKGGQYLVPLRDRVRRLEKLAEGDVVTLRLGSARSLT